MARMCKHNRQFAHCGDCWNNRCDICDSTLDGFNDCLTHGIRESPAPPLAGREALLIKGNGAEFIVSEKSATSISFDNKPVPTKTRKRYRSRLY